MTDIISGFAVIIFSLIGVVASVRFLVFRLYRSKQDYTIMLITPASGIAQDIEYTLRSCAAKVRWMGKVRPYKVICLDKGMDKTTRKVCETICSEYEFMTVMTQDELNTALESSGDNSYIE